VPVAFNGDLRIFPSARSHRRRRPHATDLDIHREAKADETALGASRLAFGLQLFPPGFFERDVQRLLVIA
jgi:hypothetical protein